MSGQDWRPPMCGDAEMRARYVPGMPHPAGTGPAAARCSACVWWTAHSEPAPGRRLGRCARWLRTQGRSRFHHHDPLLDWYQPACRAFTPRRSGVEVAS